MAFSTLNKLFDAIAVIMPQYTENTERCLIWTLAVVRNKEKLKNQLAGYTKRSMLESLETVSKEQSKRGLLASLLKSQLARN